MTHAQVDLPSKLAICRQIIPSGQPEASVGCGDQDMSLGAQGRMQRWLKHSGATEPVCGTGQSLSDSQGYSHSVWNQQSTERPVSGSWLQGPSHSHEPLAGSGHRVGPTGPYSLSH